MTYCTENCTKCVIFYRNNKKGRATTKDQLFGREENGGDGQGQPGEQQIGGMVRTVFIYATYYKLYRKRAIIFIKQENG